MREKSGITPKSFSSLEKKEAHLESVLGHVKFEVPFRRSSGDVQPVLSEAVRRAVLTEGMHAFRGNFVDYVLRQP